MFLSWLLLIGISEDPKLPPCSDFLKAIHNKIHILKFKEWLDMQANTHNQNFDFIYRHGKITKQPSDFSPN